MSLDPTLHLYALALACALVAAAMHAVRLASGLDPWPPRRQLTGQLIASGVVGLAVATVARWLPWEPDPLAVIVASAVLGHTVGPGGLRWLAEGGVLNLRRVPGLQVPDLPPEPESPEKSDTPQEVKPGAE